MINNFDDSNRKQTGLTGGPSTLPQCLGQVEQREFPKEKRYENVFLLLFILLLSWCVFFLQWNLHLTRISLYPGSLHTY